MSRREWQRFFEHKPIKTPEPRLEFTDTEIRLKLTIKDEERLKEIKLEEQTLNTELAQLKKLRVSHSVNWVDLEAKYHALEPKAWELRSVDFYIHRSEFFQTRAQKELKIEQKINFYESALLDYKQAFKYDPFLENIPQYIETLENELGALQSGSTGIKLFNAELKDNAPTLGMNRLTLPKREELTKEQSAQLKQMEETLLQQEIERIIQERVKQQLDKH